jgi:hypothetical protein
MFCRAPVDRLNVRAPDDLAHGAFGDRLHRAFRLLDIEQIIAYPVRLDLPQNGEVDIDDIFVAGEHQALFRHAADRGAAAQVRRHSHADIDLVDAQSLRSQRRLDWNGR